MLKKKQISLRLLTDSDLDFLYSIENNPENKKYGGENVYLSKNLLKDYIKNAKSDITTFNQLRFVITFKDRSIGLIDLFEYDINKKTAKVGVFILKEYQKKKHGSNALSLLISYSWSNLGLVSLFSNINPKNNLSISLFNKFSFKKKTDTLYQLDR